jgi:hypothetical protein
MPNPDEEEGLEKSLGFNSINRTGLETCLKETGCSVVYMVIDFSNTKPIDFTFDKVLLSNCTRFSLMK